MPARADGRIAVRTRPRFSAVMERAMVCEPGQRIGIRLALKAPRCLPRLRKHDLEMPDPRLQVMLAPALGIPRRAFEVRLRCGTLPFTGVNVIVLLGLGLCMVAIGLAVRRVSRRSAPLGSR